MRFRLAVGLFIVPLFGVAAETPACSQLPLQGTLRTRISAKRPACFRLHLPSGQATQLFVNQPINLEIHVVGKAHEFLVDSFNFGPETVTIPFSGDFRIEVRSASEAKNTATFVMSRKAISLPAAIKWRQSEQMATLNRTAESLRLWTTVGDHFSVARTYLKRGKVAYLAGDTMGAHSVFDQALEICTALKEIRCIGEAANNSGITAKRMGDFSATAKRFRQASNAWKALGDLPLQGRTLSNLGTLHYETGDYQGAIGYLTQAQAILRPSNGSPYAVVLNNLGYCYESIGKHRVARTYFRSALEAHLRTGPSQNASTARINIARSFLIEGNYQMAETLLRRMIAAGLPDRNTLAGAQSNLGQALLGRQQTQEAASLLRQALATHRSLSAKPFEAADLHHLGLAAYANHDIQAARENLTLAAKIRSDVGLRDLTGDSLYSLAQIEREVGNLQTAKSLVTRAIRLSESTRLRVPSGALRATYFSRKRRFFDLLIDLEAQSNARTALVAAERGRSRTMLDTLAQASLLRRAPQEVNGNRDVLQRKLDLLSTLLANATGEQEASLRRQVDDLLVQDAEMEAQINTTLATETFGAPLSSVEPLQKSLPPKSALLEYHLGGHSSYLWFVTAETIQIYMLPPRANIESDSRAVLELFPRVMDRKRSPQARKAFEQALNRLSETLLAPLNGVTLPEKLILAPDGILAKIPFAALRKFNNANLGLEHDLIQVPSASYLLVGRKPRPISAFPKTVLALADPIFSPTDPRLADLKSTKPIPDLHLARLPFHAELNTISSTVPQSRRRVLLGLEATTASLLSHKPADFAFLHLSTHAILDDVQPELSRIALSRGTILRPKQLEALGLDGSTVVLSACDTGLGKELPGEGLMGFAGALFQAGAAQLILTTAKVDAESSAEFLSQVYKKTFAAQPVATETAARMARISLSKSTRWHDPYYWAPFTVHGRPRD